MRILIIAYSIILFVHNCFGNIYENYIPETIVYQHESSFTQDSLYLQQGKDCIEKLDFDSARKYLLKSANSNDIPIKAESFLYLNFIETRLQNYETTLGYLEQYHKNAMLLYHRTLDIEDTVRNHKEDIDSVINSIDRQSKIKLQLVIYFCVFLLIIIVLLIFFQQKSLFIFSNKKKNELEILNSTIRSKQEESRTLSYNAYLLQAEIFKKTPIYMEIKDLEKRANNKNTSVLNYKKQEYLQQEIDAIFENFQKDLCCLNVKLTKNDMKFCCLSLLPVNSFAKALCFGSSEINIIKQRKYYIKKKMTEESDNKPLFDFIFSVRRE